MKKIVLLVCFCCFISMSGLVACDNAQSVGKTRGSKLDQDAVDMAKIFYFNKRIVRCGDFTYTSLADEGIGGDQLIRVKDKGSFTVKRWDISEADKLNGVEWRGWVIFEAKGPSQQRWASQPSYGAWGVVGIHKEITLEKVNAGWGVKGYQPGYPIFKQISCEQVAR